MNGQEFFFVELIFAVTLAGFSGLIANYRRIPTNERERLRLRVVLMLSLYTVVLALIPFPLHYLSEALFSVETVWRLASSVMALVLLFEISRRLLYSQTGHAKNHALHLVLMFVSVLMLVLEGLNVLIWSSLAVYTLGLLWMSILQGIQFTVFACYDDETQPITHALPARNISILHNRVWSVGIPRDTDNAPNPHSHCHDDSAIHTPFNRSH